MPLMKLDKCVIKEYKGANIGLKLRFDKYSIVLYLQNSGNTSTQKHPVDFLNSAIF